MGNVLIDFFILGQIPGTTVRVEFWQVLTFVVTIVFLCVLVWSLRQVRRSLQLIDPYRGAPRGMSYIDLISL